MMQGIWIWTASSVLVGAEKFAAPAGFFGEENSYCVLHLLHCDEYSALFYH